MFPIHMIYKIHIVATDRVSGFEEIITVDSMEELITAYQQSDPCYEILDGVLFDFSEVRIHLAHLVATEVKIGSYQIAREGC